MDDSLIAYAITGVIALGVAVFIRQRGWGIALPLITLGALVGLAPIGPTAPPEPELVLIVILAPLVFGEAMGSSSAKSTRNASISWIRSSGPTIAAARVRARCSQTHASFR